jgi:hypothetical protein
MAYFPFTVILISDTSRKKTLVCMHNEVNKIQFGSLQCWNYRWECFMRYTVEMVSHGMIHIPSFMKSGSGIEVILRLLLPRQYERL